ncbi:MAG: hypothetical protein WD401_05155, partial [Thermomicrobiaceae bacterium]
MSQPTTASAGRRPEFVTLIAVYQLVTAGILFLLSCMIPAVLFPSIIFYVEASEGVFGAIAVATAALAFFIGFGVASVIVGWGLLRMREWARIGAIVLAAFALIGFPIWTIVGILVLVYMTSDDARNAFAGASAEREKQESGNPRYHDALAAQAAYKTDPAPRAGTSPLDDTRPMSTPSKGHASYGGMASGTLSEQETHQIEPIAMPPPTDPAEATEHFYDEESDVSDHYRRWKASLPQESPPAGDTSHREPPA